MRESLYLQSDLQFLFKERQLCYVIIIAVLQIKKPRVSKIKWFAKNYLASET